MKSQTRVLPMYSYKNSRVVQTNSKLPNSHRHFRIREVPSSFRGQMTKCLDSELPSSLAIPGDLSAGVSSIILMPFVGPYPSAVKFVELIQCR
jgi:hypothetical protein